jgi:hypothetical protein
MTLQTLSFRAYGKQHTYLKVMRNGIPADMEDSLEDGNIRVYKGLKYPDLKEITTIMEKLIENKLEAEALAAKQLEADQQPFKNIPAPELKPFTAEVTANTAGPSGEIQD